MKEDLFYRRKWQSVTALLFCAQRARKKIYFGLSFYSPDSLYILEGINVLKFEYQERGSCAVGFTVN